MTLTQFDQFGYFLRVFELKKQISSFNNKR